MKEKIAALGSLLVSAILSTCCTLPLALASLGLGSLGLGTLIKPVRPFMIAVAALLLAFGFYRVYHRRTTTQNRVLIWISAAVFAVVVGTPYAVTYFKGEDAFTLAAYPGMRKIVVQLDDVNYRACCEPPAKEALRALPGVREVLINHKTKEAILIVDPAAKIDNELVMRTLEAVDKKGRIKEEISPSPSED